jgi:hypothetical protein
VSHVSECKKKDLSPPTQAEHLSEGLNLKQSADIMASYLKDRELNPAIESTQKGFLHLFSAWIPDESFPWTTGEALSLHILFKYLKTKFILLSNTTRCDGRR